MSSVAPKPMPTAEEVLETALKLPKEQRLRLADRLWDSAEAEESAESMQLDPELHEELVRRLKSIEDGTAVLLDGDQVLRDLRAKYGR